MKNLSRILRCFNVVSGLKVNFSKSKVFGPGVSEGDIARGATILGCEVSSIPFKYLGVPVGANMNLKKNWKPIIDRFNSKLSSWKARSLSFGGRTTLINYVLGNLPTYYLSLFKAPAGVIDQLESLRRRFLWGGNEESRKIPWIAWDKIVNSKENGGIGVGSLRSLNIALLVKWWWRLRSESSAIWSRTVIGIHNLHRNPPEKLSNRSIVGVWNNIAGADKELIKFGLNYHQIFRKENESDIWKCKISGNGQYTVKCLREEFNKSSFPNLGCENIKWLKVIPYKVLCFIWKANLGGIQTKVGLARRGVNIPSLTCDLCSCGDEDRDHVLISCSVAKLIWKDIGSWCEVRLDNMNSTQELMNAVNGWGRCPKKRRILVIIVYATLWYIWKSRNENVFRHVQISSSVVADQIKANVYNWIKLRGDKYKLNWLGWNLTPYICI